LKSHEKKLGGGQPAPKAGFSLFVNPEFLDRY